MTQKEMFLEIWQERPRVSEVSGKPLLPIGDFKWHWQICHVLGKGPFPRFKFYKENIMLMLPEEHTIQETFELFIDKKEQLLTLYYNSSSCYECAAIIGKDELLCNACNNKAANLF